VHLGCLPHIPHNPHWIERLCTSGGASSLPVHPADDPCARAHHKVSPAKLDDLCEFQSRSFCRLVNSDVVVLPCGQQKPIYIHRGIVPQSKSNGAENHAVFPDGGELHFVPRVRVVACCSLQ
jgi:hypothetical protein